jgi:hypothetical protein
MKGVRNYLRAVRKGLRTPCFLQAILYRFIFRTFIRFALQKGQFLLALSIPQFSSYLQNQKSAGAAPHALTLQVSPMAALLHVPFVYFNTSL